MMIPERPKISTVILSRLGEGGEQKEVAVKPEADMRDESDLDMITHDILGAIKSGSMIQLKDSIRAFMKACEEEESGE